MDGGTPTCISDGAHLGSQAMVIVLHRNESHAEIGVGFQKSVPDVSVAVVFRPAQDARTLLDSIEVERDRGDGVTEPLPLGLRDRALIGVMVFSFARISAVLGMKVEDYYPNGKRWWLRLHEKGGKFHEVPAHHNAEAYLDAYIEAAGIAAETKGPLFRSVLGKSGKLTTRPLRRDNALARPLLGRGIDGAVGGEADAVKFKP